MRRPKEREDTCAAICGWCHRFWDNGDLATFRAAKEWAIRLGFREALREIEHRIALAEEARRTPSVPIRVEVRDG